MAMNETPLGFRKPAETDLARRGADAIAHNAQLADDLIKDLQVNGTVNPETVEANLPERLSPGELSAAIDTGARPVKLVGPEPLEIAGTQPGHTWSFLSGSGNLSNSSDRLLGTQSVTFSTSTTATQTVLVNSGLDLRAAGAHLVAFFKVTDISALAGLSLYATSEPVVAGSAASWQWSIANQITPEDVAYVRSGEWVRLVLPWSSATINGDAKLLDKNSVKSFSLRATGKAGRSAGIAFAGIGVTPASSQYPKGVVTFTFDDGIRSTYQNGLPILSRYGFPATCYVIPETILDTLRDDRMTVGELLDLENGHGWEVSGHNAYLGTDHTSFPVADLDRSLSQTRAFLNQHGFRGVDDGAAPYGRQSAELIETTRKYGTHGRSGSASHPMPTDTLPPSDPMKVRCTAVTSATSPATINALVDKAVANQEWLVLVIHGVETPATGTATSEAILSSIVDHVASSGATVRTLTDVIAQAEPSLAPALGSMSLQIVSAEVEATIFEGMPVWAIPDAGALGVYWQGVLLPRDAKPGGKLYLDLAWSTAPTTGDVYIVHTVRGLMPGDTHVSAVTETRGYVPIRSAPAVADSLVRSRLMLRDNHAEPGKMISVRTARNTTSSADTLVGDVRIISAELLYERI